jgi:NDP-sugar pyrophosphorylase family protein
MKAVLLAAGLGTRLAPVSSAIPKILTPVAGEPLLIRQLRFLAASGVTQVAINLHHFAEKVEACLRTVVTPLQVVVYREHQLRGTAGALAPMRDFLTDRFLVLYGDVVTDADLGDFQRGSRGIATLAYYRSPEALEKGVIALDDNDRVVSFMEKPRDGRNGCVNAGVYSLDPDILEFIPETGDFGFDVWPRVIASGKAIYGREVSGYVLDMGSPIALTQLEADVRRGAVKW